MYDFKPIELTAKEVFDDFFSQDPPQTSELTFTNLFMWRHRYRPKWRRREDCLLIILHPLDSLPFALPPVGPGNKRGALDFLAKLLGDLTNEVMICRVSKDFVEELVDPEQYEIVKDRDNSDYVYLAEDLINLPGNKYHGKKNHINRFTKDYEFEYRELDLDLVHCCLNLQESWCEIKDCGESPALMAEDMAIYEALKNYEELDYKGGVILVNSLVEAFSLGEMLNPDTAVIHVEKANPEIPGLYAVINQLFCQEAWSKAKFMNREQDLGIEGLRKAKKSYYPHHMVEKFMLRPKTD
ncbi:MAG: DUF2156 domain-containing protein [Desulfomonile tiedjei]|nr:DUF2156 domain-containing protein [Desulfomonile tiedjei]